LERFIRKVLGLNGLANTQDLVAKLAMLFFAGGGKFPLALSDTGLPFLITVLTVPFPGSLFDGSIVVVVVWVSGPAAPVLRPLFASYFLPGLDYIVAKLVK
jgi:hypothetical protein